MKTTRNLFAIALALVLLLTLTACAKEPAGQDMAAFHKAWVWGSNVEGALTEQGYYYIPRDGRRILTYMDAASGQSVALCQIAGCTHSGSSCDAYLETFFAEMFFVQEHLYYYHQDGSLRRRSATGTDEVTVGVPGRVFLDEGISVELGSYIATQQYLYYTASLATPSPHAGQSTNISSGRYLGRMDLRSGKDEVLLRQEITEGWSFQSIQLCAAQDGGVLFYYSEGIPVEHDDPDLVEKSRAMKVSLRMWDAATGKEKTIMEKSRQDFLEVYLVDSGKVYFGGMDNPTVKMRPDMMVYDLVSGTETVVQEQAHFIAWGGGWGMLLRDEGRSVLNLATGQTDAVDMRALYPKAISSAGFVIQNYIMSQENANSVAAIAYCYIPYASLADGLTESDVLTVYTVKTGFSSN